MLMTKISIGYQDYAVPTDFDLNMLKKLMTITKKGDSYVFSDGGDITITTYVIVKEPKDEPTD